MVQSRLSEKELTLRFCRRMLKDQPLLTPDRIGTGGPSTYPPAMWPALPALLIPEARP